MSLSALIHATLRKVRGGSDGSPTEPYQANTSKLSIRLWDVLLRTFDLGVTAFGGPPVHFQIFHRRFVDGMGKAPWIDEQTVSLLPLLNQLDPTDCHTKYQEVFAIVQALPGPASTKMLFTIAQIRAGLIPALLVFGFWSLPVACAMFGLALGVQRIDDVLPDPVYALLSGLNAATVGIIALAAVQLARKAISDKLTRLLVLFGGGAGLCYNALWYFPVLIAVAGLATVIWDTWLRSFIGRIAQKRRDKRRGTQEDVTAQAERGLPETTLPTHTKSEEPTQLQRRSGTARASSDVELVDRNDQDDKSTTQEKITPPPTVRTESGHGVPVKIGISLIVIFFLIFTALMLIRGLLHTPPLLLSLFNNMFLAGTIIFGGGPVVIPLLREYVVEPGWVSPRDFLIGLAIIQAMPGPNFNFAVYLGALAALNNSTERNAALSLAGAVLAFLGIFFPGMFLSVGFQSIWRALRSKPVVASLLRGINAGAVGLVFTAVYRLWEIGYLTKESTRGISLAKEPWWLVVAATTFTVVEWFNVAPPVAILGGGVAGLAWYGVVSS